MDIKVISFFDLTDNCFKYYSVHGEGHYFDYYEDALREELIGLKLLIPISN